MISAPLPASAPGPALLDAVTATPTTMSTAGGLLLPLLVGLVTTPSWPRAAKGLMLAAAAFGCSAAAAMGHADALGGTGPPDWGVVLDGTLPTWLAAQSAHGSVWRHTALSARLQVLGTRPPPDPVHGSAATIERAQGPTPPREPGRLERARPPRGRDTVRPRSPAPPRDPDPSGRHAWQRPNDPPRDR